MIHHVFQQLHAPMSRLLLLLGLCGGIPAATATAATTGAPSKNVLFIVADDLRPELGCYGAARVFTPHLDALAKRGVTFTRAYCQQAVCNPSRSSALTGLRPDRIRVWDLAARFRETTPGIVTLPEYFKQRGYFTQGIGKIFHNETRTTPGRVSMTDPVSWTIAPSFASGAHWQDWVVPGDPTGPKSKGEAVQALDVPDESYLDGQISRAACVALQQLKQQSTPFFLAVGFWKPHLPFNAPRKYWDLYQRSQFEALALPGFPEDAPTIAHHTWHELRGYGGVPKSGPLNPGQAAELRHGYYAAISFLDAQVGLVLRQLRELGLEEDTIVVVWGDHGFHLGEHDLWAKTSNYELDARVPLIIAAPGIASQGTQSHALVELVDLFPTVVDLVGLPVPANLDGISLKANLIEPTRRGKDFALTQHPHPFYSGDWTAMGYSLRTERHRYVEWRDRSSGSVTARELYDHQLDPAETQNRVNDPIEAGTVETLAALVRRAYDLNP